MGLSFCERHLARTVPFRPTMRVRQAQAIQCGAASYFHRFIADIQKMLALQVHWTGNAGSTARRTRRVAVALSDTRQIVCGRSTWVDSTSSVCTQFFSPLNSRTSASKGVSRRLRWAAPHYDTANVWRSLLIAAPPRASPTVCTRRASAVCGCVPIPCGADPMA